MNLRLFHYWRSSSSWRVRWALALKGIPCEFIAVNLLDDESEQPAHLARNPMGFVPALEILNSKSSVRFLGESVAIIEWLEEVHPLPTLFPNDPLERARTRQLAEIVNAGTQPVQNLSVTLRHSPDPEEQKKWSQHWIRKGLGAYEKLVQETAGLFSIGNTLTFADLFLIPQCYNAGRNDVPLSEFPTIQKIHEQAIQTEACMKSSPDRFKP